MIYIIAFALGLCMTGILLIREDYAVMRSRMEQTIEWLERKGIEREIPVKERTESDA